MNANDLTTIDQVCAFMSGTQRVVFEVAGDQQGRYDWVRRTLVKFDYSGCGKADRGVLISYLLKVSSYSRAQVKRLIKRYRETGRLTPRQRTVRGFTRRYTKVDIRLLASYPFVIRGFHADNGSEYINRRVARLLEKLRIEFTKSRARHSNDNALQQARRTLFATIYEQEQKRA